MLGPKDAHDHPQQTLDEFRKRLELLISSYDRFFRGLIKIEPTKERKELKRIILLIPSRAFHSHTHQFTFQQLVASFNAYSRLWDRKLEELYKK